MNKQLAVALIALAAMTCGLRPVLAQTAAMPAPGADTETFGEAIELVDPDVLRVCSDPSNMPFSSEKLDGFENKIADLIGEKLGKPVSYSWFPMATGFVRKTLGEHRCDIIIGYAQGNELVQNTNAYYRTSYAFVFPEGSDLEGLQSLDDPRLKSKKIGIIAGTPPGNNMAHYGLMGRAKPYPLMIDTRVESSAARMMKDLDAGIIDVAILWGPMAGYYAKQDATPMKVVPMVKETWGPRMAYRITMGVRRTDQNWKRQLNTLIRENQGEINKILLDYGVPILDERDQPITQ